MARPFAAPGTPTQYLPDRPVVVQHVRLELDLDLAGRRLSGRSILTLGVRRDAVAAVELHAVDMQIDEVTVDDKATSDFHYDGERLRIDLGQASRARRPAGTGRGLPGLAPPGPVFHRARRGSPGAAAAVLDPGPGRGQPALLAGRRPAGGEGHQRDDLHRPAGAVRAVQRRAAANARISTSSGRAGTTSSTFPTPPTWSPWCAAASPR